jgi:hypothetical protein
MADKALAAAAFLARFEEGAVTVVTVGDGAETQELRERAAAQLRDRGVPGRFRPLSRSNVSRLAALVRREGCGTLVLPADSTLLEDEALLELVDEIEAPTLFVR